MPVLNLAQGKERTSHTWAQCGKSDIKHVNMIKYNNVNLGAVLWTSKNYDISVLIC